MSHKKKDRLNKTISSNDDSPNKSTGGLESNEINADEEGCTSHYSPVAVKSPRTVTTSGRLTGLPRKVKDTCADWHNHLQDWNVLNTTGMQLISEIANAKIAAGLEAEKEPGEAADLSEIKPDELQGLCKKLKNVYLSMEKLVKKFEQMTSWLQGVAALNQSYQSDSQMTAMASLSSSFAETHEDVLFQTWPAHMFGDTSQKLLDMYKQELHLKKHITENVAHCPNRETLMVYTAVWLHQPYIDTESEIMLEGMLLETGLR